MQAKLKEANVPLDALYLDPNNPRFADITPSAKNIPEHRVHEEGVQKTAMDRITHANFDIAQLKESIKTIGFLPVDRLVVVELPQPDKYMVIEGNRRLAALKSLVQDVASGEEDLTPEIEASVTNIPVLIIQDDDKSVRDHFARVLQGVRHVSSVKSWGPYQQAQIIVMMIQDGNMLAEIKEALGLSTVRINSLRRSYYALEQMQKDAEFEAHATPAKFSYFEEAYKQQKLRNWMEWDDENNVYRNDDNRRMFYNWCTPYEEDGHQYEPKIVDSKELRQIGSLMDNQALFKQFCESPSLRLQNAKSGLIEDNTIDWRGILSTNLRTLKQIPAVALMNSTDDDVQLLTEVQTLCRQLILQVQRTHSTNDNNSL